MLEPIICYWRTCALCGVDILHDEPEGDPETTPGVLCQRCEGGIRQEVADEAWREDERDFGINEPYTGDF